MIVQDVLATTGITATAGIGTNLYLCKVAMDIVAKHVEPDVDGVRIAKLNERSYRHLLWDHRPLTDFWRVGHGYARKLEANGIFTMGDVARCSINRENLLYKLFGVNAELLIDHAWGWEPCTIKDIKEYKPSSNSISFGQVLHCPYTWQKARLIVREMTDALAVIHNKYRVQANENLGELIQSVKKHIINSAHYNEYVMPPKVSTYDHVVSYCSLRDKYPKNPQ